MSSLNDDVDRLEQAMRLLMQSIKRPQRWQKITDRAGIKIDRPAAIMLHILVSRQPASMRVHDLAVQLGIEPPSVTRKTQELERLGYLQRVEDPQDRRAISLQVTAAGRKISERLRKAQLQILNEALAEWPADERRQFVVLFERFSNNFTERTK